MPNSKRNPTTLPLSDLTQDEWESLCDGCGQCCLVKLEDEDEGTIYYTDVACRLFDDHSCRCRDYENRNREVPDCVILTLKTVYETRWLPATCAYRLRAMNKPLPDWHPLISGTSESVKKAGASVQGRVSCLEDDIEVEALTDHIIHEFAAKT